MLLTIDLTRTASRDLCLSLYPCTQKDVRRDGVQGRLSTLRGDFSAAAANAQSLFASIQGHIGSRTGEQKVAASVQTTPSQQQEQQQKEGTGQSLLRRISLRRDAQGTVFYQACFLRMHVQCPVIGVS